MIHIDRKKCKELADHLRHLTIPAPAEEGELPGVSDSELPNFYFLAVALCHQTSPVGGPTLGGLLSSGERSYGWDYLRRRLAERAAADKLLLRPATWASMTAEQLDALLVDANGKLTLMNAAGRTQLIRNLGMRCFTLGVDQLNELYERCGGWLVGGPNGGLFYQLSQFSAYRDPVKKKSCYFLELMRNQNRWVYKDPANLGAPVDYHEVRGHLRIGTVVIEDDELREQLDERHEVSAEQDLAIRQAVFDAINLVSHIHGSCDPATLHYLFWNVFRNCCQRDHQHCNSHEDSCGLPQRYYEAFPASGRDRCGFAPVCASAGRPHKLIEHQHQTDFY